LQELTVEPIGDGENLLISDIRTFHLPGHSPDCLAVLVGDEAIIVGDVVLPDITPWPTREEAFDEVARVIKPDYTKADVIFGLQSYLKSLKTLGKVASQHPDLLVLPAHRLYHKGQWNGIQLARRISELLNHHIERCGAIIDILETGPKTADEIARAYFEEHLLEGFGSMMAANEIVSHCEMLVKSGDVLPIDRHKYAATGSAFFEQTIRNLAPDD
jgi:glyoxylase-like metal-dependent hydrolase (beta-lactamase superfamily II)